MKKYARDLWSRASDALQTARVDLSVSYDASASRAYYAVRDNHQNLDSII